MTKDGSTPRRDRLAIAVSGALAALALGVAGCGGDDDSTATAGATGATGAQGGGGAPVTVNLQAPTGGQANQIGHTLVEANNFEEIGNSFANAFDVPETITIKGVNGFGGGPFFNPRNNSITFQYGFANLVYETLAQVNPNWNNYRLGEGIGAVDSFIFAHEYGHALVSVFDLPVLGREEDAADDLATLMLLKIPEGPQYVSDAASFWAAFSERQSVPKLAEYADVHSFDLQRAYTMMCMLAGSSKESFNNVARLGVLPDSRLAGCPAEYEEKVQSFEQVLDPHVEGGVNLQAAAG